VGNTTIIKEDYRTLCVVKYIGRVIHSCISLVMEANGVDFIDYLNLIITW
jgi:hypothetical protein